MYSCPPIGILGSRTVLAWITAEVESAGSATPALRTVDGIIWTLGLGITAVFVLRAGYRGWRRRAWPAPLALAPERPSSFTPEMIFLAMTIFLAVLLFVSPAEPAGQNQSPSPVSSQPSTSGAPQPGPASEPVANEQEEVGVWSTIAAMTLPQMAGIAVCLVMAWRSFEGGVRGFLFGRRHWARGVGLALMLAVVAIALSDALAWLTFVAVSRFVPEYVFPDHATLVALQDQSLSVGAIWMLRLAAGLVAPVAEEVFFRGLVQTVLLRVMRSRLLVIVIPAAVFSVAHLSQPHVLPALFMLGLILGYTYERTGSLLAPILIHVLFNTRTLLYSAVAMTQA